MPPLRAVVGDGQVILCPIRALFGLDCPLCGGLRMAGSLLRGDLPAALHYNAVAFAFLLLCGWSVAMWAIGRRRGKQVRSWQHWRRTPAAAGVVFVAWFVVRNLPFPPFSALHV
ncbi:MAG TPA: DUF2752 domain-containing protein [Amycolatopsis sp.]|uniref:DUF2752 domain-containing protein n=1 Tax=Amycolatopsis sp. TaxID=37632 RepID=UPI002B46CC9B|nr:DUF2752 domain-containing protein [Amycolatopsis sp.]HKS46014.1 DUF2752 domain-containing protein [Amycolatopsis sp.]